MTSIAFRLVIGLLLAATSMCIAQQNKTVRICVNVQTATSPASIDNVQGSVPTLLQMQTKALSERRPDKTHHIVLQGIALADLGERPSGIPGTSPSYEKYGTQLTAADLKLAQDRACDYVLFSLASGIWSEHGSVPNMGLGVRYGADAQSPELSLRVIYRLHQVPPRAPVVEGTVSANDTAPAFGLYMRAFDMVAAQVFTRITKNSATTAHTP